MKRVWHVIQMALAAVLVAASLLALIAFVAMIIMLESSPGEGGGFGSIQAWVFIAGAGVSLLALYLSYRWIRRIDPSSLTTRAQPKPLSEHEQSWAWCCIPFAFGSVIFAMAQGGCASKLLVSGTAMAAIFLGTHLLVGAHELGHAVIGIAAGKEPHFMRVGVGPVIWRSRDWFNFAIEWRLVPETGMVVSAPSKSGYLRLRSWIYVAGGPAASAACAIALWHFAHGFHVPSAIGLSEIWVVCIEALAVLAMLLLVLTLLPRYGIVSGIRIPTDGLQLIQVLRRPNASEAEVTWYTLRNCITLLRHVGEHERALHLLRRAMIQHPGLATRLEYVEVESLMHDGRFSEGAELLERALAAGNLPANWTRSARLQLAICYISEGNRLKGAPLVEEILSECSEQESASIRDALASAPLYSGRTEFLADAKVWIAEALRIEPERETLWTTEAALCAEEGDTTAEERLREIFRRNPAESDRALAAFYIAKLMRKRNAAEREVAAWRKRALLLCGSGTPNPRRRIEAECGAER